MKKVNSFLAGFGLSSILIFGGLEKSIAEEKTWFTTPDTVSVIAEQLLNRQSERSQKPVARKKFSFKPMPFSKCSSFLITEVFFSVGLDKPSDDTSLRLCTWEIGYMVNSGKHSAIGGAFFFATDGDFGPSRWGLRARYRYWLSKSASIDIAPGILITGWKREFAFPSFTCQVGLNLNEWFALAAQVDIPRWKESGHRSTFEAARTDSNNLDKVATRPEWYLGFKVGTPAGAGAATGLALLVMGAAAMFFGPGIGGI